MIVTCLRCQGSYDMDYEEAWDDHHTAPDGSECAPADCIVDMIGLCHQDHSSDWSVETVELDDDEDDDEDDDDEPVDWVDLVGERGRD